MLPAFIRIDAHFSLRDVGPSIADSLPQEAIGKPLWHYFRFLGGMDVSDLLLATQSDQHVELQALHAGLHLRGPAFALEDGFLLATHRVYSLDGLSSGDARVTDFAPGDIVVPTRMLLGMQQQMLEEARVAAADLQAERATIATMTGRNRLLAGRTAHEFNNCLTIIRLKCQHLDGISELDPIARRDVAIIHETARRATDVSATLLALAHDHAQPPTVVEVDALLQGNKSYFQTLTGPATNITLNLGAANAKLHVSRSMFLLAVSHILMDISASSRACEAMLLRTQIEKDGQGHLALKLAVSNTGYDKSPEMLNTGLIPIFPSGAPEERNKPVTLHKFVEECGGELDISFDNTVSTIVSLKFPIAEASPAPSRQSPVPDNCVLRVLLVEDEQHALEAFQESIEDEGHTVTPAANGHIALEALQQTTFDVLLSDVAMPGINGIELAHRARQHDAGLPVILMSGYVPNSDNWHPEWHFIRKPFDWEDLFAKLRMIEPRQYNQ
ncbi:MAG: response regulator [Formivibrio sp.]|nr:response regulator [Formivibrio sp.]